MTTVPSAPIRSRTPMQSARATNGSGLARRRSYGSSLSIRPIAGTSSKPAVVSSSTRAPLRSSSAFVPTVVPSVTEATADGSTPASSKQSKIACAGAAGRRRLLADDEHARLVVEHDEVGEGASGVDAGVERHAQPSGWRHRRTAAASTRRRAPRSRDRRSPRARRPPPRSTRGRRAAGRRAGTRRPCGRDPVEAQRPPLAHGASEHAVAVVELGCGLAALERRPRRAARGRASPPPRRAHRQRAPAGTTTTPSSSPRTRSPGATVDAGAGDRLAPAGDERAPERVARRDRRPRTPARRGGGSRRRRGCRRR